MPPVISRLLPGFLAFLAAAPIAMGCSVPVYRYALERWPPDAYHAKIFHRGPLTEAQRQLVQRLKDSDANLDVATIDLQTEDDPVLLQLWAEQKTDTLPWLYATYPASHPVAVELAAGPLAEGLVTDLLDSQFRQDLAARLVKGDTAVWVFVDSGDSKKDEAAWTRLNDVLKELEATLELPAIEQADIDAGLISIPEDALKIAFSVKRLSRKAPADEMFLRMLLDTEDDLLELHEPMAFPVFGRGRVLYALVGAGINESTIGYAASYLVGACSCQVKAQNPGVDLLLAMNWDESVQSAYQLDRPLPELTGFVPGSEPASENETAPGTATPPAGPTPDGSKAPGEEPPPAAKTSPGPDPKLILWTTLPALVLMLAIVGIGSVLLLRKKP